MGARAASGTLAGSTSGSWTSIHKGAASSDFSRFGRHPSGRPTRTTLSTVAGSDRAVGCGEHTVQWSPTVTTSQSTRLSEPWHSGSRPRRPLWSKRSLKLMPSGSRMQSRAGRNVAWLVVSDGGSEVAHGRPCQRGWIWVQAATRRPRSSGSSGAVAGAPCRCRGRPLAADPMPAS